MVTLLELHGWHLQVTRTLHIAEFLTLAVISGFVTSWATGSTKAGSSWCPACHCIWHLLISVLCLTASPSGVSIYWPCLSAMPLTDARHIFHQPIHSKCIYLSSTMNQTQQPGLEKTVVNKTGTFLLITDLGFQQHKNYYPHFINRKSLAPVSRMSQSTHTSQPQKCQGQDSNMFLAGMV